MGQQAASKTLILIFILILHNSIAFVREPTTRWSLAPFLKQLTSIDPAAHLASNDSPGETQSDPSHRVGFYMAPLIGGPSWLPLHVKLFIEAEDGTRHLLDFVPKDASNPDVTGRLMSFQCVPGDVRYACQSSGGKQERQDVTRVVLHPSNDSTERARRLPQNRSEASIVERAVQYSAAYPDRDLHLLTNNCWSFAVRLYWHLLSTSD
jgi:hypothetical protein